MREQEAERESAADSTPGRGGKKKKYAAHYWQISVTSIAP
jgi:hypothetical protein